ncbi:MAG TPA: SprB repeat-containing protein, partial [Bacteroidia bacterium]|nr:SprB repeat-containing protein [Bacteroidia bacterium]
MAVSLLICTKSSAQLQLIHYWDFNSTSPSGGAGGINLSPLHADYSKISTTTAYLSLGITPTSYTLDNGPSGSTLNEYHMLGNDTFGLAADNYYIRARNPLQNIPFFWHLPTTNYENITLTFASELSSAGKAVLSYSYSLDGGTTYSTTGLPITTYTPGTTWSTSVINLSTIPGANNNPNFVFIISNTLNTTGNYRFDNIALLGDTVTVSAAATNSSCFGGVGSATATPSGTGPFTYTWAPSGGNAAIANNLTPGTYTVSVTDTYSITATTTVAVTQPNVLSSVITSTNVNCFGNNTGSASVIVSGGTTGYTYTWSPSGGNAAIANNLAAGNYTVNVTDANSCTTSTLVTITQPTAALSASISASTNVNCFGNNSGSATASVTGGTSSYTYTWSPSGGNTATASNLLAGTYTVNVMDANGCNTNTVVTISQPTAALNANISASTNISCNGGSNGSATVSVSGGTSSYTYTWSPSGGNAVVASNLTAGNYTINVTDNKGCMASNTVTITQPNVALTASITASNNVTCFGLSNGTATVSGSGGTGSYTYLWSNNQTSATATNLSATHTQKLIHYWDMNNTLPLTGAGGITVSPLAAGYSTLGHAYLVWNNLPTTPASCGCPKRDSILDNGSGGSTLNEYPVLGNDSSGTTAGNLYIRMRNPSNNLKFLWYMPTTNYKNIKLSYAAELSSAGKANNTYWYSLDSGLTFSQTNLPVTSYTPGITWATQTLDLSAIAGANNNPKFVFAITNTSAGAIGTGGNCRFDNIALQGDTIIAGPTYTAIITDANGCKSNLASVTITQPALLTASVSSSINVSCLGGSTGSATASVTGGNTSFTYTWSPSGGNNVTANNLTAGNYTISVTDNKGCTASNSVTITQPATAVSVSVTSSTNVQCNGGSTGAATANVTGGSPTYSYTWSPSGGNSATGTNLSAGTYTLNVTDNKGCATSTTVSITQPNVMTTSITTFTNVNCNGNSNGAASITVTDGSGTYTYQWDDANNQTTATASNLLASTYNCYVTDVICNTTATSSVSITQPNIMTASITSFSNVACNGNNTGSATVSASAGSGTYTYQWNDANNQTTAAATNLAAGNYTCVVMDVTCGTTVTNTISLTQPNVMAASVSSFSNVTCNGNNTGSATVSASAGSGTYTYQWNDANNQTTAAATNLVAGNYTCVVMDVTCGTTVTNTVSLTQPNVMTASVTSFSNVACNGNNTGSATVLALAGSGTYTYQWNDANNQTTAAATNLVAGNYTCVVMDVTCGTTVTN